MPLPRIFDGVTEALGLYSLATLCRIGYVPDPDCVQCFSRVHGYNASWQIHSFGGSPANTPNVAVINGVDHFVVVINGSTTMAHVVDPFFHFGPAQVTGPPFTLYANTIYKGWADAIKAWLVLAGVSVATPTLFVGHSMGGALAHLLQYLFLQEDVAKTWKSVSVSFGCPKFATSGVWARVGLDRSHVFRVMADWDPITNLPCDLSGTAYRYSVVGDGRVPYRHGGHWVWINNRGSRRHFQTGAGEESAIDLRNSNYSGWGFRANEAAPLNATYLAYHTLFNYTRRLRDEIVNAPRATLFPLTWINQKFDLAAGEAVLPLEAMWTHLRGLEVLIPEEPAINYETTSGTWDELIHDYATVPDRSTEPQFIVPMTIPVQALVDGERELRRRRRN